jgi:hypothetical protein
MLCSLMVLVKRQLPQELRSLGRSRCLRSCRQYAKIIPKRRNSSSNQQRQIPLLVQMLLRPGVWGLVKVAGGRIALAGLAQAMGAGMVLTMARVLVEGAVLRRQAADA